MQRTRQADHATSACPSACLPLGLASQPARAAVKTPVARASQTSQVLLGASSYGLGAGAAGLWLAPRLVHPGLVGAAALSVPPLWGWLWRHLARAPDAPTWSGPAAAAWAGVQHVAQGLAWGLVLPSALGPLHGLYLGVAALTVAVAYGLDRYTRAPTQRSAWAVCGDVAHLVAALLAALSYALAARAHGRQAPSRNAPAAEQALYRVASVQHQQRARLAWQRVADSERALWNRGPGLWPITADNAAVWGRIGWSTACALGAVSMGKTPLRAVGMATVVGMGMALPRTALNAAARPGRTPQAARAAGQTLAYHLLIIGFGLGAYAA